MATDDPVTLYTSGQYGLSVVTPRSRIDNVAIAALFTAFGIAPLTGVIADSLWLNRAVFVPSEVFSTFFIALGVLLPLAITLTLLVRRVLGKVQLEWFLIVVSLPAMMLGAMFLWFGAQGAVSGLLVMGLGEQRTATIQLWSSRKQCGKGCFIRNDFSLGERDAFWKSKREIALGQYKVLLSSSSLGDVVINPPEDGP